MKKLVFFLLVVLMSMQAFAQHNAGNNGKILMIASNPSVSKTTGWPIGVWYAELTHPYWVFNEAGYTVDIASLNGGEIIFDGFSDPEDESKYAAFDYISLGFKKDPNKMALTKNTLKLSSVNPNDYKAIFVCGGQGPMYTMYKNPEILKFFSDFYQTGKPAAAICHGTSILLDTKLSNGKYLVAGKKWTGFANSEENYADAYVGKKIQPFRIEDEARKMPNSKFEVAHMFEAYAVRDGNLITGQQQNSGAKAAELVLQALEDDKKRYPTYVLVHGAWADESAWGFVRNDLAKNANVVVVNLPAHGADNTYGVGIGLKNYVKTVSDAINKINGKVILVGHSMGGMVISQVAENLPNKIDKLVYVSAFLPKNGESLNSIVNTVTQGKTPDFFKFNQEYSLLSIKKEAIPQVVCADCPDFMKDVLVKYHRAEPVQGFNDVVKLGVNFNKVPKYYISTKNDNAVPFALQQKMIKDNGTVKKVFEMETSHLPFVVKPQEFLNLLTSIK
ncbi:alpha/beta fold hydrolase [Chryseobacterium salviniae]|uniref:Alpha/beta fold hydrolase n=1 Tax=Chryseobacterium salviniae TaxID=3101750 RepID=A0ABU6HML2_9FLAO|nr:alpha/beta fold hydrolase [Chryseobacterium sp. T9W2-O]MEC3874173.1 alpha/beta fold hydrolase [Chryseobacterium sp. T9W2-O]